MLGAVQTAPSSTRQLRERAALRRSYPVLVYGRAITAASGSATQGDDQVHGHRKGLR